MTQNTNNNLEVVNETNKQSETNRIVDIVSKNVAAFLNSTSENMNNLPSSDKVEQQLMTYGSKIANTLIHGVKETANFIGPYLDHAHTQTTQELKNYFEGLSAYRQGVWDAVESLPSTLADAISGSVDFSDACDEFLMCFGQTGESSNVDSLSDTQE